MPTSPTTAEALAALMAGREAPVPLEAFGSGRFAASAGA
jgi:glycine/D-amino acid oxidase-like deaminating enzyme